MKKIIKLIIILKQSNLSHVLWFGAKLTLLGERIQIYARMRHDSFTVKQPTEHFSCSKEHRDKEQDTEKEEPSPIMSL